MKYFLLILIAIFSFSQAQGAKITVVTENNSPYQELTNGEIGGVATAIIIEVLNESGIDYEIGLYPWARAYKMAQVQENVLIYSIARSEERETQFHWIDEIVPFSVFMYGLAGSDINITTLEGAKAYEVGVINKGFRHEFFVRSGFEEGKNMTSINKDIHNISKLIAGRIDLMPFDEIGLKSKAKQLGFDTSRFEKLFEIDGMSTSLYAAFSKQTSPEIVNKVKVAFRRIKGDGRYKAIIDKYLNEN